MKKFISGLAIILLVMLVPTKVLANEGGTIGAGGETTPSVRTGGVNVHEFPADSAIYGYRIYLAPTDIILTSSKTNLRDDSSYESYAKYATYVINKTLIGKTTSTRLFYNQGEKTKFSFSESNQTLGDFVTLKYGASSKFVSMEGMNFYNGNATTGKINLLINLINRAEVSAPKVKGRTNYAYPESVLATYIASKTDTRHFHETAKTSVLYRNWAVDDGNHDYFKQVLDVNSSSNSAINELLGSRNTTIDKVVDGFLDYTVGAYPAAQELEGMHLSVVIEPVFGYINKHISSPAIMTATQYARWALGQTSNYSSGHGIMYHYEKRSSVNNAKANYEASRTANRTETKLWSTTAYNYASTLRPYESVSDTSKLSELGGIGIIRPDDGSERLTLNLYADYIYSNEDGVAAEVKAEGASRWNSEPDGVPRGWEDNFAIESRAFDTTKGEATEVTGTSLINNEHNGLVTRYYTTLLSLSGNPNKDLGYVDITSFVKKYGKGVLDFKDGKASEKMEELFSEWLTEAIENSKVLKEKPSRALNVTDAVYKGVPESNNLDTLGLTIMNSLNLSSKLNFGGLDPRAEWGENGSPKKAWTDTLNAEWHIQSFSTGTTVEDITKFTTKYSGNLEIYQDGNRVLAQGTIPLTVGITVELPEVLSCYTYLTYEIEDEDISTSSINLRNDGFFKHSFNLGIVGKPEGSAPEVRAIANYFAIRLDNYTKDGQKVRDIEGSLVSVNEVTEYIKELLDNNPLNNTNNRADLKKIEQDISTKFNLDEQGVKMIYLGDGSHNKSVALTCRLTEEGVRYGTYAIIIEHVDLATPQQANTFARLRDKNSLVDMEEYELNTLENFYAMPGGIIINRYDMSDPSFRKASSTDTERILTNEDNRTGSPIQNSAPIMGDYDIETVLNGSGISALKPAFTWVANRLQSFNTANGSGSTSTKHELYAISRANLGDIRRVADYSEWNLGNKRANKSLSGTTIKGVLDILGVKYDTKPDKDLTTSSGAKDLVTKSGSYGTQKIVTADGTGWIIRDTYDRETRYWVSSGYSTTKYKYDPITETLEPDGTRWVDTSHWSTWESAGTVSDTQLITNGKFLHGAGLTDTRAYNVDYSMATYVSAKESTKNSNNNVTRDIDSFTQDNGNLANTSIVDRSTLLTSIDLEDRSKTSLGIYPEIEMWYYTPSSNSVLYSKNSVPNNAWSQLGDEYQGYNNGNGGTHTGNNESSINVDIDSIYTIGEKARYFNPTSYMTIEVYGRDEKTSKLQDTDIKGKLSSSATSTSSRVKNLLSNMGVSNSETPVILSGGSYNINLDRALKLELTSYSVDIASVGDGVISSSNTSTELDMKSTWQDLVTGDSYSAEDTHKAFVNNTVGNLEQTLSVVVDGDNQQIVENLTVKESTHKELITTIEATYNIYIRGGIVENKQDIINSIAEDLKRESTNAMLPSKALEKAESIYRGLKIEEAIVKQLESNKDSINESDDRDGSKWYDEACSTLVIRKYITKIDVGNINASDKIDIQWGPKQEAQRDNLYSKGNKAGFEYTMKFLEDLIELPSGTNVTVDKPLVQSVVKDTNFVIPDATISDSRH